MKKIICLLAVIALTAPVIAGDITITLDEDGNLGYSYTGAAPVGIALTVSADAAVEYAADADPFFDVYLDYAYDNPSYNIGDGVPVAKVEEAGVATMPATDFALCMGELDPCDAAAAGALGVISGPAGTEVCVELNDLRGGIVDVNGEAMTVTLPECVTLGGAGCATCPGDINGNNAVEPTDYQAMVAILNARFAENGTFVVPQGHALYNACADMNSNGAVEPTDYQAIVALLNAAFADHGTFVSPCP